MSVLIILYLCVGYPLLLGLLGKHFAPQAKLPAYVVGHGMQFAVMFLCGLVIKYISISMFSFARAYGIIALVIGIFCVILTCRDWKQTITWRPTIWNVIILLGEVGLIYGSILFLLPHWLDLTEETLYQLQATGQLDDVAYLLYGVVLELCGCNPVTLVRLWLPICLLPLLFSVCHFFAQNRPWFLVFAYFVFISYVFVPGYIGVEVLLNIWNPVTLCISVWLPVFYYLLIQLFWNNNRTIFQGIGLVIIVLAMQGLMPQACLYAAVLALIAVGIRLGYYVYDKMGGDR